MQITWAVATELWASQNVRPSACLLAARDSCSTRSTPAGPRAGLVDLVRRGSFKAGERVLFWHTGGAPALFAEQYQDL